MRFSCIGACLLEEYPGLFDYRDQTLVAHEVYLFNLIQLIHDYGALLGFTLEGFLVLATEHLIIMFFIRLLVYSAHAIFYYVSHQHLQLLVILFRLLYFLQPQPMKHLLDGF